MSYEYKNLKDGERQYDEIDVENKIVEAIYRKVEGEEGNRTAEALPPPREKDEVLAAYSAGIPGYRWEKVKDMSKLEKLTQLSQ